jgi:regulatory protein
MRITQLIPQRRRPDRTNIYLDGAFAFALDGALAAAEGLTVDRELTPAEVERLKALEVERGLFDAALRFLTPRPRSRAEVRHRLLSPRPNKRIPSAETVERVLDRLEEMELLDDREFAAFWVENRERFSPRAARALGQELRQRGVTREMAEAVSQPERDEERALEAGRGRLRALAGLDYLSFRNRLGQFLLRRGFSHGVVRIAVRALWTETHDSAEEASDGEVREDADIDEGAGLDG